MYVSIYKQFTGFHKCFGVLARFCYETIQRRFFHSKSLHEQHDAVLRACPVPCYLRTWQHLSFNEL